MMNVCNGDVVVLVLVVLLLVFDLVLVMEVG